MKQLKLIITIIKIIFTWLTPLNFKQLVQDIKWAIKNQK